VEATVKGYSVDMHAEMTRDSAVVKNLQAGDTVTIEYEAKGKGGRWCFVTLKGSTAMGYVPCENLKYKAKARRWSRLLDKFNDKAEEQRSGQGSGVRVVLYMTDW
jgi:hypothetical protein